MFIFIRSYKTKKNENDENSKFKITIAGDDQPTINLCLILCHRRNFMKKLCWKLFLILYSDLICRIDSMC